MIYLKTIINWYNLEIVENTKRGGNMKNILKTFLSIVLILLLTGCKSDARMAVEEYLNKYQSLNSEVKTDMSGVIDKENLNEENRKLYNDVFNKQYQDLKYVVESEEYDGDEATVKVKITVYDYYQSQKESTKYLANNADEFNDANGVYDAQKYLNYKLNNMKKVTETIDYTIDFYVLKTAKGWVVSNPSNSDLEKIHGIYNYES